MVCMFSSSLEFDTDDDKFIAGVEVGRVWQKLIDHPLYDVVEVVHDENAEMFLRMAEKLERKFESTGLGDGWLEVVYKAVD